jgi:hypothetical protein
MLAKQVKRGKVVNKIVVSPKTTERMAPPSKEKTTYYQRLDESSTRALQKHPKSTVVMNANTLEVVATGRDIAKLAEKMKLANRREVEVVIGHVPVNQITMFGCR